MPEEVKVEEAVVEQTTVIEPGIPGMQYVNLFTDKSVSNPYSTKEEAIAKSGPDKGVITIPVTDLKKHFVEGEDVYMGRRFGLVKSSNLKLFPAGGPECQWVVFNSAHFEPKTVEAEATV